MLALGLLCFSLTAQSPALDPRQNKPVSLLQTNNTPALNESQTEAGSPCTVDCVHLQTSDAKTISEIQNIITKTSEESCELLSSQQKLKDGKLTDYWAQEMIGADLLKEEIEKAPPLPEDKFLTAVFDGPRYRHNIHVQNLISHKKDQAVLPELNDSQLRYFDTSIPSQYITAVESIIKDVNIENNSMEDSVQMEAEELFSQKKIPSFINNSMSWSRSRTVYKAMSKIHPPAILVKAAGNNYPDSLSFIENQFAKDFDSILVGSLSPNGVVSSFSQEGEEVHILAPSDNWITSIGREGEYAKFGGCSGAAPLVTGSLAGFEWLSGYHPTAKEAKFLLEQTAIPTIHSEFEDPQRNGVGMLNAYKLGMTAKRLKEKCHTDPDCFQREIRNKANYEFSIDEEDILEQTNKAFPECSDQKEVQAISCADKKAAFKKLRQAVLLDIENVSLLKKLQCIYTQEGFLENALNIEIAIIAVTRDKDQVLKTLKDLIQNSNSYVKQRMISVFGIIGGAKGLEMLKDLAKDSDAKVRRIVAYSAGQIGGVEGLKILKDLAKDASIRVREEVASAMGRIGGREALEVLKVLAHDSDVLVRIEATDMIGWIGGKEGLEILKDLTKHSDARVRQRIAGAMERIGGGGKKVLEILKDLAQDSDSMVKGYVASAVGSIGGRESLEMLKIILAQDSSEWVREKVASAVGSIGGRESLEILKIILAQDSSAFLKVAAVRSIEKIGGHEGLEMLKDLAKDSDEWVRETATKAIQELQ